MDHVRGAHNVPGDIKKVSLETLFPPWTVTRQVYTESLTSRHSGISNNVLLYRVVTDPPLPGAQEGPSPCCVLQKLYVAAARSSSLPTVLSIEGGSPKPACSSLPCAAESPDVACASPQPSRCAIGRRRPN